MRLPLGSLGRCGNRFDGWKFRGLRARIRLVGGGHDARRTRRVDQHRVLAQQTAVGLIELHEEIQERFVDRFAGRHPDHLAAAAQDRSEFEVIEKEHPLDAGPTEFIRRSQAGREIVLRQRADIDQRDVGLERLIEG